MLSQEFEIIKKEDLAPRVTLFEVRAPLIAGKVEPGQFVIVRLSERGERIPLTVYDFDQEKGTIFMVVQDIGHTTSLMCALNEGDNILDLVGPLGTASEIENYGNVVCVGGGIAIAAMFPILRALKQAGNTTLSIIGSKTADLLILEEEVRKYSDELFITTDDGSKGHKGFVTDVLSGILEERQVDVIWAIGPMIMMRAVAGITIPKNVRTIVSLNPIMVDGTGMCGGCRVKVGDKMKFACVDGPEFDARFVDFDELFARLKAYDRM